MNQDTLHRFCRQLALWAEAVIAQGRSPFRRVETFPAILTEAGEQEPPLVFWINRDSWMAGGVLMLPRREAEEAVSAGRHCAAALGLRHFVTWGAREVVYWEERAQGPVRLRAIGFESGEDAAATLQSLLANVMEELKVLSVIGSVPPAQLSTHYLANLCRTTLVAALPLLEESARVARGEGRLTGIEPTAELARGKGFLTLVRLLALVHHDRLPGTVQPERLEQAMRFALDTLPEAIRPALLPGAGEIPLPSEAGVRFHHLLRRLTQLQAGADRRRAAATLELLLAAEVGALGGFPLPFPAADSDGSSLLINPDRLYPRERSPVEVAAAPLLAAFALLRQLRDDPPALQQSVDPFAIAPASPPQAIRGTLCGDRPPGEPQRRRLTTTLRISWPTRRFPLPRHTPAWVWTFLHLAGLASDGASLELTLPGGWFTTDYGAVLMQLIREEFTLRQLERGDGQTLRLRLTRGQDPAAAVTVGGPEGPRQLTWNRLRTTHPSLLTLAMALPDELWGLLECDFLQLPDEKGEPAADDATLDLFLNSSLGAFLWQLVSGSRSLPPPASRQAEVRRYGLPLPTVEILADLPLSTIGAHGEPAALDDWLAQRLGICVQLPGRNAGLGRPRSGTRGAVSTPDRDALAEQITAAVFVDGLPCFPEQYLYDHYRPQLVGYAFVGPLTVDGTFFDRVTLRDRQDTRIEVDGAETARALHLASFGSRSAVELPADRQLTAAILESYLADLRALRRELVRQSHLHLADRREADAMVERIWNSRTLPPWPLVAG